MHTRILWSFLLGLLLMGGTLHAQNNIVINTGLIDGIELTRQNILSYQIVSTLNYPLNADVTGTLFYRNNDLRINYSYTMKINPGINQADGNQAPVNWTYSSAALRELFEDYNKLPAGTYQYCIKVTPKNVAGEHDMGNVTEECLYNKNEEMFLINLVDPENDAKLYEKNPSLSWVANYTFSSDLTYKLRVAEIRKGQNTVTAISRNNPVYTENNLRQNTLIYPVSAKPLQVNQPYAWTVDAFYKGILLGGAEPWKFTIIEDTLLANIPKESSYIDVKDQQGKTMSYAVGKLKLKYLLKDYRTDSLHLTLMQNGSEVKLKNNILNAYQGDNKYIIDFENTPKLKHGKIYVLNIENAYRQKYAITFRYINPAFL